MSKSIRILLIEDNTCDAELVRQLFNAEHDTISLEWVTCLREAIERLSQSRFDVVLADLTLPDSDGLDTVTAVCRASIDTPVIVLTGLDDSDFATQLLALGAQDYFVKGEFTGSGLLRTIRHSIQRHENYRRISQLLEALEEKGHKLEAQNKKLARLYAQAHEFVDNVSHEFRTPLTVVKEYVSLVRDEFAGPVNDEQIRLLNIAEDRADDLNTMVDDMLDVSKLESGLLGACRKNCPASDIWSHVRDSLQRKANVKQTELEWDIQAGLPVVYCDPEKAGRVLTNLAINAIKFCGDPGIVRISAHLDQENNEVQFSIQDNGQGIDESSLSAIFQRFKQVPGSARGSTKGFGLGLNIAKELVDLNFGRLSVKSQVGQGSTFSFSVPVGDPTVVTSRYLQRLNAIAETEHLDRRLAVFQVICNNQRDELLADDFDAFLNYTLRTHDLLFRSSTDQWVVILPESEADTHTSIERLQAERTKANRNRPFGALPEFETKYLGNWDFVTDEAAILSCLSDCFRTSEQGSVAAWETSDFSAMK